TEKQSLPSEEFAKSFKTGIAEICYPHGIRSLRASCMVVEYHFDIYKIMDWMSWDSIEMAKMYVKLNRDAFRTEMNKKEFAVN
ncbi:MAG: hypothetical protein JRN15_19765, partial [Nitrososphaerota archaeon]|nr:hypothetical protein [Nitrososphaerota archaeon]